MPCLNPSRPHIGLPPTCRALDPAEVDPAVREMLWAEWEMDSWIKKMVGRRSRRHRDSTRRELIDYKREQLRMLSGVLDETPAAEVWWYVG